MSEQKVVTAKSARFQARLFNIGNIIVMLPGMIIAPVFMFSMPEGVARIVMLLMMMVPPILWFGISMLVYALMRHNPNERVGHHTQQAAYRFYGLFGSIIPIGTFYGTQWELWVYTGGAVAGILVPWSLFALYQIQKENWVDTDFASKV